MQYDALFPQLESIEIHPSKLQFDQERIESSQLFQSQTNAINIDQLTLGAVEVKPQEFPDLPIGTVVPSIEAVDWPQHRNVDIRPRLVDSASGIERLLDSGAQISATKRTPEDKPDNSVNLVAVNGSRIPTYGVKEVEVKINRKRYKIQAVVCDVSQDILGMDFMKKYKLGLEWDDFDQTELFIVDKKANIRSPVKIVTVPKDITRAHHLEPVAVGSVPSQSADKSTPSEGATLPASGVGGPSRYHTTLFEVACMKKLSPEPPEPSMAKAKRRPIIADSEKARKGKEAWDKMEEDGVIEKVKPGMNTDWSSALHLADKPGGGVRLCPDFRVLNTKTVTDAHPLPFLKDFTKKIHGSEIFSKVDLRSAFFNIPIYPPHEHKTLTLSP